MVSEFLHFDGTLRGNAPQTKTEKVLCALKIINTFFNDMTNLK